MKKILSIDVLTFLFLLLSACTPGKMANQRFVDSEQNVSLLQNSVVSLFGVAADGDLEGPNCTAFFISPTILITAKHCINSPGFEASEIMPGVEIILPIGADMPMLGRKFPFVDYPGYSDWLASGPTGKILIYNSTVIDVSENYDLAVLLVEEDYQSRFWLHLSHDLPAVGERIYTMGMPLHQPWILSEGVVASLRSALSDEPVIFHQAPIAPGASGGPLVNNYGLLVGINIAFLKEARYLSVAVPVKHLHALADVYM